MVYFRRWECQKTTAQIPMLRHELAKFRNGPYHRYHLFSYDTFIAAAQKQTLWSCIFQTSLDASVTHFFAKLRRRVGNLAGFQEMLNLGSKVVPKNFEPMSMSLHYWSKMIQNGFPSNTSELVEQEQHSASTVYQARASLRRGHT